jgi:hypothetical protein
LFADFLQGRRVDSQVKNCFKKISQIMHFFAFAFVSRPIRKANQSRHKIQLLAFLPFATKDDRMTVEGDHGRAPQNPWQLSW